MKLLVWKEYRQNRMVVGFTLLSIALPYLMCTSAYLSQKFVPQNPISKTNWSDFLGMACIYSICIPQLSMALIGGNLIAGERADRSAEFQGYLPIRRSHLVLAKLTLAFFIAALIWLLNPFVFVSFTKSLQELANRIGLEQFHSDGSFFLLALFTNAAVTGLTFFCGAWLISSFTASPTLSVCMGILIPLVTATTLCIIANIGEIPDQLAAEFIQFWYCAICLPLALICFAAGTLIYLRKSSP